MDSTTYLTERSNSLASDYEYPMIHRLLTTRMYRSLNYCTKSSDSSEIHIQASVNMIPALASVSSAASNSFCLCTTFRAIRRSLYPAHAHHSNHGIPQIGIVSPRNTIIHWCGNIHRIIPINATPKNTPTTMPTIFCACGDTSGSSVRLARIVRRDTAKVWRTKGIRYQSGRGCEVGGHAYLQYWEWCHRHGSKVMRSGICSSRT